MMFTMSFYVVLLQELPSSFLPSLQVVEEARTFQRPVFTQPLQNLDNLTEGELAHFECRLIPVGDPRLRVEWFRNEKPIETSELFYLYMIIFDHINGP